MQYPYIRAYLTLASCNKEFIGLMVKRAARANCSQDTICQSKEHGWLRLKDLGNDGRMVRMVKHEGNVLINAAAKKKKK